MKINAILFTTLLLSLNACKPNPEDTGGHQVKFDVLSAKVVAPSSYIMLGGKYQAEVFLSASSSSLPFEMIMDSTGDPDHSVKYENGICTFSSIPDHEGLCTFSGKLKMQFEGNKEPSYYPFSTEYMVARPQAVIVPTEFVLYRGKENKLNISIPGVAPGDLSVLVSNASSKGENGSYSVTPGKESTCIITVAFRNTKGAFVKLDQKEYNVVDK